ncbi:NERD domain-containing protein [Cytobacillus suaedae]|nr:NERD domain-containing protein [Cytobacillus suaedae]
MIIKTREEPLELMLLRILNNRMHLTEKDVNYLISLEKGFKGEQKYDVWLEKYLSGEWIVINDLLLDYNNNVFQIDSLLVSSKKMYLFNVKNYECDFYIEDNRWYSPYDSEIKDPLLQLSRSETLLRQLLVVLGFKPQIEALLIFINPEFHLYQAPLKLPAIFPSQLSRFMGKLNMCTSPLKARDTKLAQKLLSLHIKYNPYSRLPDYSYDNLKKGIICASCNSFNQKVSNNNIVCLDCGFVEKVNKGVLRSLEEYQLLFPDERITVNSVQDWCKVITNKNTVRNILSELYLLKVHGRSSFYVRK